MPLRAFHTATPGPGDSPQGGAAPGRRPVDSDARKRRDAALRHGDEQIAEALEQARRSGELQSAQSYGKPMAEMEGYAQTPAELRMPFKILKNADAPPPEVELFRRRAALRAQVAAWPAGQPPSPEQRRLQQSLAELEQALALRLEHLRQTGSL